MSRANNKSPFARALASLLDETNLFDRSDWAEVLGVSEPAISQWVGDKTIPRADNLHMIVTTLERSSDVPKRPLVAFKKLADRPAIEVSPFGKRMLPTVWDYMMRPAFSELSSKLAKLPPEEQERILEKEFLQTKITVGAEIPEVKKRVAALPRRRRRGSAARLAEPVLSHTTTIASFGQPRSDAEPITNLQSFLSGYISPTLQLEQSPQAVAADRATTARPTEIANPNVEWEEILRSRHTVILAGPGMGKTSLLRYLHWHLLHESSGTSDRDKECCPIYVPLRELATVRNAEEIWGAIQRMDPTDTPPERVFLLLDGFDEVPPERRVLLGRVISDFREHYPEAGLIVTSRPTPDVHVFDRMTWYRIQAPSDSRLFALVYKQLLAFMVGTEQKWDDSLLRLSSCLRERPDVFRAIRSPLLLSYAARLFARAPIAACHDTELFGACLRFLIQEWDEEKRVVRHSVSTVGQGVLFQWLGGICYHTLAERLTEFTSHQVATWFKGYLEGTPVDKDLQALSESTGLIEPSEGNRWRFTHPTFQEYLAAKHVVESSREATDFLKESTREPRMARVLKFACAITHDASPLLGFVLRSKWPSEGEKMSTLADIIAQQFNAERGVVEQSCDALVRWLERSFDGWTVASTTEDDTIFFPEAKWRLAVRGIGTKRSEESGTGKQLLHSLLAVHRARWSPVKQQLSERLGSASSGIVRSIGESLDVEGYLQGQVLSRTDADVLVAKVVEI